MSDGLDRLGRRCGAVAFALVVERFVADPPTPFHPVAWFGSAMTRLEHRIWDDRRASGVAYTAAGVGLGGLAGLLVPLPVAVVVGVGGRQLRQVATWIAAAATAGDLDAARARLPWLVGRDPSGLDASGVAAAVIESVAENSVDAVVAPALWGVIAGAPGVLAYRAVNTMDAMVGHRSARFERFGWAAARLDDVANLLPARVFAVLVAAQGDRPMASLRAAARDAGPHPSPNAGLAEATMARHLGVSLGGTLRYGDRIEHRPELGAGPAPRPADVAPAVRVASRAQWLLTTVLALVWLVTRRGSVPSSPRSRWSQR